MISDKQEYINLCNQTADIDIFMQKWWLDTIYDKLWNVFLYKKQGKILSAMVYHIKTKLCFKTIMPQCLTPHQGVYFFVDNQSPNFEQIKLEAYNYFAKKIQSLHLDAVFYSFLISNTDIDKIFGQKYKYIVNQRYTYKIDLSQDLLAIMQPRRRRYVKSGLKNLSVNIYQGDMHQMYMLVKQTFSLQNTPIPYPEEFFINLVISSINHHQGEVIVAQDNEDNIHSLLWVVWDKINCYSLACSTIPEFRKSNSLSLLHYYAMVKAKQRGQRYYDFEGSMIERIAKYFALFGGEKYYYYSVEKYFNCLYKLLRKIHLH